MMRLFPEGASSMAGEVDLLYFVLLGISVFFILAVAGPILYFSVKYRRGSLANRSRPSHGSLRIEAGWTLFPLLLSLGLYGAGATVYLRDQRPPSEALQVYVVAKQWMWKVQHANGRREIDELHVPVGQSVRLVMTSQDVIHSFFVPAFRIKQDVLPGRFTSMWFQATKVGTYHLFCAEYCGTNHSAMTGRVVVMTGAGFENWLRTGPENESLAKSGERLFRRLGCSGCHEGSPVVRAPSLAGLFGRPVPLQGGGTVMADETYIRDSILLPSTQIAAGFENLMPTFQGLVTDDEILQLVAYIKSLANQPAGEPATTKIP
jgi:cytochrome c oxidase subunit II